jgi:hypothetical protein
MKQENLYEAIGDIEDTFVNEAHTANKKAHPAWHKWGAVAACLALMVLVGSFFLPSTPGEETHTPPTSELATRFTAAYLYYVDDGAFASYMGGKVIDESKIGVKIEDVTLTAGWKNSEGEWIRVEHLRGELYLIEGISPETAVALKFLDKGEAVTTTHYYTILNPDGDLSSMQEYYITPLLPTDSTVPQMTQTTDEFTNEANHPSEEYVEGVTVTSQASE